MIKFDFLYVPSDMMHINIKNCKSHIVDSCIARNILSYCLLSFYCHFRINQIAIFDNIETMVNSESDEKFTIMFAILAIKMTTEKCSLRQ